VKPNPYDEVAYPCWPRLETHADRLAAAATLFGMTPAPVSECRVLEVGCGDGGNLIPMAYELRGSEFVGLELVRTPVAEARRTIGALRLRNVRIVRGDLRRAGRELGEFDYIVAHGLYSWLPAEARDALLALCRDRLAPAGVAMISYNVYPGRHIRQMLREMMLYHTGGAASSEAARGLLEAVRAQAMLTPAWRGLLDEEIGEMLGRETASLVHDDLAPVNEPCYFHEFAARAAGRGLQYLCDAHLHESLDPAGATAGVKDRIAREQYLDFLKLRRFRQTLLCRAEVRLARAPLAGRIGRLAYSSPARVEGEWLVGANGVRVRRRGDVVEAMAGAMAEAWPRPIPAKQLARGAGAREALRHLCLGGFVEPHAWTFPAPRAAGERPRVSALARLQLQRSRFATNLCHRTVELDEATCALARLADGSRDLAALARDWGRKRRQTAEAVDWLARMALIEG
jgi:SAM-dependent methyltransferase